MHDLWGVAVSYGRGTPVPTTTDLVLLAQPTVDNLHTQRPLMKNRERLLIENCDRPLLEKRDRPLIERLRQTLERYFLVGGPGPRRRRLVKGQSDTGAFFLSQTFPCTLRCSVLSDVGSQVQGLRCRVSGAGSQLQGLRCRVSGVGSQVQGLRCRISGAGSQV